MSTARQVIVQLTDLFTGEPATPVWDDTSRPPVTKVVDANNFAAVLEGLRGNTDVAIRAATIDVYGQQGDWSDYILATTSKDADAPEATQGISAVGGFRGAAVSWSPTTASDLAHYALDFSTDNTFPEGAFSTVQTKSTVIWVAGLTPETSVGLADVTYYFRVSTIDTSGNVGAYSETVSAVATQVGSTDIASHSVTTEHVSTSGLSADVIKTGTITITPVASSISGAVAITVTDDDGVTPLGQWTPEDGIKVYSSTDSSDYAVLDDGYLRFYRDGILTAEIGPDGILADSITLGTLPGGHNLVLNSSFEGAAFSTAASTTVTFTDNSGTPGWKAANRTTALVNLTEGATSISATSLSF